MEYREDDLAEMIEADRRGAIFGARRLLEADPLILDTETTGLDENAEICELAIITHEGKVVVDSLSNRLPRFLLRLQQCMELRARMFRTLRRCSRL